MRTSGVSFTDEWQQVEGTFTISDEMTWARAPIHFSIAGNEGDTIYVDNLRIVDPTASDIALGFESLAGLDSWKNTSSDPGFTLTLSDDAAEGDSALQVQYDFVASESWGGSVDFAFSAPDTAFTALRNYDGITMKYKVVEPVEPQTDVSFAIKLVDNSTDTEEFWETRVAEVITDASGEWQELRVPFDAFALPSWVDQGDGELDLDEIVRWEMQVIVSGGGAGNTYTGTILLDDLGVYDEAGVANEPREVPSTFALMQNYPNPFNPTTTIEYELDASVHVRLAVYDLLGQRVATLVDGVQAAGRHAARFDAMDLASGVYLYQLQAGTRVQTRRMMLVK